ncbi:hypothetical protein [uncultured Sulfitobacter sp.]|uniref:hypothetical protein n=1 Tax=uncultured Sulfitobacter sp. TaxID=191468 RepID=UPI00262B0B96|nr:hypothetical protein [uncultured Sulfitobacter sp.]
MSGPFLVGGGGDMPISLVVIALLGPQIWAIAARKSAVVRMSALSLSLVFLAALPVAVWRHIWMQDHDQIAGSQDTYYVVSLFHHFAGLALPACTLTVVLAATARWAAPLPRATAWIASVFAVCLTIMATRPSWDRWLVDHPKRYEDYEAYVAQRITIDTYSGLLSAVIFWSLIALCLIALLRRLNQWSKTG